MDKTRVIIAVAAVVVIGAGVGAAAFTGVLPGTGGGPAPEGTPPAASESTPDENATFNFTVDDVSRCGQVCRLLNATTTNRLDRPAENVTLHIQIFAGDEGVWQGTTQVGDLDPGESAETTTRIEVGLSGARAVQANGGNVTYVTDVRATNASQQFQGQTNVNE